jgi:hypothetical protein
MVDPAQLGIDLQADVADHLKQRKQRLYNIAATTTFSVTKKN